jgi:hypothetical protein
MAVGAAARPADDPCARGAARARAAWTPLMATSLRGAMAGARAGDAALAAGAVDKLDARAAQLVTAHGAACRAQPTPPVLACLAARQVELDAVVAELTARGDLAGDAADAFAFTIADARLCHAPGRRRSSRAGRAPPGQRRAVADARIAAIAAEALRDAARFTEARAAAAALAPQVAAAGWPPLEAEHLYLQAGIETIGGDSMAGHATMQRAAAVAERVHADYIAASAWSQLAQATTWDERDPTRGLEYAGYADAALTRLGAADARGPRPLLARHVADRGGRSRRRRGRSARGARAGRDRRARADPGDHPGPRAGARGARRVRRGRRHVPARAHRAGRARRRSGARAAVPRAPGDLPRARR